MARLLNKSKKEIGISPDELLFRGEKKVNEIISNLKTLDGKIKKLKKAYNDDPVNHLNDIFIENAKLYNYFTKIYINKTS